MGAGLILSLLLLPAALPAQSLVFSIPGTVNMGVLMDYGFAWLEAVGDCEGATGAYCLEEPPEPPTRARSKDSVKDFAPSPDLNVYADPNATQFAFFGGGKFQLTAGTTYYLKDAEAIPEGVSYPGARFFADSGSGSVEIPGSPTPGPGPIAWTPNAACPSGCAVRVSVGSASDSKGVVISPALPSNQLTVGVQGPSTGPVATPLAFNATVSGGTAPYSYSWNCQWNQLFGSAGFVAGAQAHACTFSIAGSYTVVVAVTDGTGTVLTSEGHAVSILGGRRGGLRR